MQPIQNTRMQNQPEPTMSDTSGDSSVGVEFCAIDAVSNNRNKVSSEDQKSNGTNDKSEPELESSSDEDNSGITLVGRTPMSERLRCVNVFEMKTKLDAIYTWLKGLVNDSTDNHVSIPNSSLRRHKRAVSSMRHCLRDAAPMAVK